MTLTRSYDISYDICQAVCHNRLFPQILDQCTVKELIKTEVTWIGVIMSIYDDAGMSLSNILLHGKRCCCVWSQNHVLT